MDTKIRHDLELLHQSLLEGKLPRNLSWSDVIELIQHLGEVQAHGSDEFVFIVGTQRAFFKKPHTHDLGVEEVSRLRKFLHDAGPAENVEPVAQPCRMVVVIDHHIAHIFQEFDGSRPEDKETVRPYDPNHFHHHLVHKKEAHYRGEHIPEDLTFYERIANDLLPAVEIVLIGHGTGKSNAADFLVDYLKKHHAAILQRVKATDTADLSALTEPEIEALAKKHMIVVA